MKGAKRKCDESSASWRLREVNTGVAFIFGLKQICLYQFRQKYFVKVSKEIAVAVTNGQVKNERGKEEEVRLNMKLQVADVNIFNS